MTLDEIKDTYAKEQLGCTDWKTFYNRNYEYVTGVKKIVYAMEQVSVIYAREKCREQRDICAKNANAVAEAGGYVYIDHESLLNAPEPKFD